MEKKRVGVLALAIAAMGILVYVGNGGLAGKGMLSQVLSGNTTTSTATNTTSCSEEWLSGKEADYKLVKDEKYPTAIKEIKKLQDEISQVKDQITANIKKIAEYKNSRTSKNTEITKNSSTISSNTAKINANNAQITVLNTYIKKNCNGWGGNSSTCKNKKNELATLTKTNSDLTIEDQKLTLKNTQLGKEVQDLTTSISKLETENADLGKKIEEKDGKIKEYDNTISTYKKIMEEYESCEKNLQSRLLITSPLVSGEITITGEVGKRVELYTFSLNVPGRKFVSGEVGTTQEMAQINAITFDVANNGSVPLGLKKWQMNDKTGTVYVCNESSDGQRVKCAPNPGEPILQINSEPVNFTLSAELSAVGDGGKYTIYGVAKEGVVYNNNRTDITNQTSPVKIVYSAGPVVPEKLGHGAVWECQNGEDAHVESRTCRPDSLWKSMAENYCKGSGIGSYGIFGDTTCGPNICGNGIKEGTEECDDGNNVNQDGCSTQCKIDENPDLCELFGTCVCGNGIKQGTEECDDGNTKNGDGCSQSCEKEGSYPGYYMTTDKQEYGNGDTILLGLSTVNGIKGYVDLYIKSLYGTEKETLIQSDIAVNPKATYKITIPNYPTIFSKTADYAIIVSAAGKPIQDDNKNSMFVKVSVPTTIVCGNGTKEGTEECDDGNIKNGDGCTSECKNESTYPGYFMTTDKQEYGNGDTIQLVISSAKDVKSYVDLYVFPSVGPGSESGFGIMKNVEINPKTTQKIAIPEYPKIFDETGSYALLVVAAGQVRNENNVNSTAVRVSVPTPIVCGNGIKEGSEECDDGNTIETDGCNKDCKEICTETDGGRDYYKYGEVTFLNKYGNPETYKEYCGENGVVEEYECIIDDTTGKYAGGKLLSSSIICSNGCKDGACNPENICPSGSTGNYPTCICTDSTKTYSETANNGNGGCVANTTSE